ncbi:MAG: cobalt transporter CbiM [Nitrospirae bacterium]|nr:cobalt transporter CbiM [Nitrospirota bacterium]
MHIPDGYIGPITYASLWALMAGIWAYAGRKVRQSLKASEVPLLALSGAFSFVIMMFNIPIPAGTTGHATGATLIAILIGPWLSVISVSIALIIQAFIFGDGGITAIGANCFNIAFIGPIGGYVIYRLIVRGKDISLRRRLVGGGIASYIGINLSALLTAIELGIQPLLHVAGNGRPLYSPFPLKVTVPVIMLEHLLVFGFIEAVVTVLVISYLEKSHPELIRGKR